MLENRSFDHMPRLSLHRAGSHRRRRQARDDERVRGESYPVQPRAGHDGRQGAGPLPPGLVREGAAGKQRRRLRQQLHEDAPRRADQLARVVMAYHTAEEVRSTPASPSSPASASAGSARSAAPPCRTAATVAGTSRGRRDNLDSPAPWTCQASSATCTRGSSRSFLQRAAEGDLSPVYSVARLLDRRQLLRRQLRPRGLERRPCALRPSGQAEARPAPAGRPSSAAPAGRRRCLSSPTTSTAASSITARRRRRRTTTRGCVATRRACPRSSSRPSWRRARSRAPSSTTPRWSRRSSPASAATSAARSRAWGRACARRRTWASRARRPSRAGDYEHTAGEPLELTDFQADWITAKREVMAARRQTLAVEAGGAPGGY